MKKYFFFDIDGTLRSGMGGPVPQSTLCCLSELRAKGHFIATATGRMQKDAVRRTAELGIINHVADGGWSITLNGEIVHMRPLPADACRSFLRQLDELRIPWAITTENEFRRITPDERFIERLNDGYFETVVTPGLNADTELPMYKIFVPCRQEEMQGLEYFGLSWVKYSEECTFIEPVDKAAGIRKMMTLLGAPMEDVVVFGDGTNDINMFRSEWTNIAMGNACALLKEKADYITADCDKDGIYLACKHFGWVE